MKLSDLIDPTAVLDAAFSHPAMAIKARSAKRPDVDTAMKAVVNAIENTVIVHIADEVQILIDDLYEGYVLLNGEWADAGEGQSDWESGMDDAVEAAIEPYNSMLSADWLGRKTIGTELHVTDDKGVNGVRGFCLSLGQEYYKTLVHDRETGKSLTPAKIMSAAGIVKTDVEERLSAHTNPTKQEQDTMAKEENAELNAVVAKIAAHLGAGFDQLTVYDDLDLASDEDDILASGPAPRLGLDESDIPLLQSERFVHGDDTAQVLLDLLIAATEAAPVKGKKAKADGKAKPEKPVKAPKAAAKVKEEPEEDAGAEAEGKYPDEISVGVLAALKECGAQDGIMAEGLGVSRATYNGYAAGKTPCKSTPQALTFVRDQLVERYNKLATAISEIDGTEPELLF